MALLDGVGSLGIIDIGIAASGGTMVPVVIVFGGIGSAGLGAVILRIADALLILALL